MALLLLLLEHHVFLTRQVTLVEWYSQLVTLPFLEVGLRQHPYLDALHAVFEHLGLFRRQVESAARDKSVSKTMSCVRFYSLIVIVGTSYQLLYGVIHKGDDDVGIIRHLTGPGIRREF